jgi:putative tryptophan/tyrosine transport system substrate-binding protein
MSVHFGVHILQQRDEVTLLYLLYNTVRHVRLNEPHPENLMPSWQGHSVGWYEGDTLVIDTVGIKVSPLSTVDPFGTPHSKALHVVERYRLIDGEAAAEDQRKHGAIFRPIPPHGRGTIDPDTAKKGLQVEFTVDDPNVFTTPWSGRVTYRRLIGYWPEAVCAENPFFLGSDEGRNVAIEYKWTEGRNDRLPALATDLVHRQVAVIASAAGIPGAQAAKAATATIPIVYFTGADPVAFGLVASMLAAARTIGLTLHILHSRSKGDLGALFTSVDELRMRALVIGAEQTFATPVWQLAFVALAAQHIIPAVSSSPSFVLGGGLMSDGNNSSEAHHIGGVYIGRILKAAKPADLPVRQSAKLELAINMRTARTLGITVPLTLLGRADEVIE